MIKSAILNLQEDTILEVCKLEKTFTSADIKIIAFVIVLWIVSIFLSVIFSGGGDKKAVIYVNGKHYASYTLNDIKDKEVLKIQNNGENIVEITKNGVRVIESDCKDKAEIRKDYINKSWQTLVCLPHKLVIKIEGGGDDIDEITY